MVTICTHIKTFVKQILRRKVMKNVFCIRIRTRVGIYGKVWPEPEGNPEGSGHIKSIS